MHIPPQRLDWFARALLGLALLIGATCAVVWVDFLPANSGQEKLPGAGIIRRAEILTLWVDPWLRNLERSRVELPDDRLLDALRADLGPERGEAAWYALIYRGHQADGRSQEITQIRRLSQAGGHLEEFREVCAAILGDPPVSNNRDFSRASVLVIPEELLPLEPREALARLATLAER